MEALSLLLDSVVLDSHISGFIVGSKTHASLTVFHILFTDDTLIFCDALPS